MNYRLIGSKLVSDGLYMNDYVATELSGRDAIPTTNLCMGSTCIIPGGSTYMWNETIWVEHVTKS